MAHPSEMSLMLLMYQQAPLFKYYHTSCIKELDIKSLNVLDMYLIYQIMEPLLNQVHLNKGNVCHHPLGIGPGHPTDSPYKKLPVKRHITK